MARRKRIPKETEAELLVRSGRRCCLCAGIDGDWTRKRGQIAHLDHDPSNNEPDNLVWLCMDHHDEYDSSTRLSKGLTQAEVERYRDALYRALERGAPPQSPPLRGGESQRGGSPPQARREGIFSIFRGRAGFTDF